MIHYSFYCEKSQNNCPCRFRSNRKLHEPDLHEMVTTAHKKDDPTKETVQRRQNREQSWRTPILHRPTCQNRTQDNNPSLLSDGTRGTQSDPRISVVRSYAAKDRLAPRMDRPLATPRHPPSAKCQKSHLHPKNQKRTTATPTKRSLLHWASHISTKTTPARGS